jgi:hypothetical protein
MSKSFGDAMVIDLETREIRCLTCNVTGAAFLRVMHLVNGDYILIGPRRLNIEDPGEGRGAKNEIWYLSSKPGSRPVAFGQRLFEGAAISKQTMKIAWSEGHVQNPELLRDQDRMFMAEIEVNDGTPKLANRRMIYESRDGKCKLEPQDFFANDTRMTFSCYETTPNHEERGQVMVVDLKSGQAENYTKLPGTFNEPEGIFPGGEYTLVESDRQARKDGVKIGEGWQIDLYKLRLDGTGKNIERLTYFNDYEGFQASNPVVSTDGRFMAFSVGHTGEVGAFTGAGHGILLSWFNK